VLAAPATFDAAPPASTPTRLLDVAERLFAEQGIDNVSIRQIVRASGQANLSAAHYHFGTREALIRALVERRLRILDAIRHERLDQVVADGLEGDARAIVDAAVGTLAIVVRETPWGVDYVRVLAQALFDPRMELLETIDPAVLGSIARARSMGRRLLPTLPAATFESRLSLVHHETVYCIARWVHANGSVTRANLRGYTRMIRDLTDFMTAGLLAPVGAAG
jgi:AcrR family transcriptional regulator